MSTTILSAHPAWCGGCEQQLTDGATVHRGIGYPITINGELGDVSPLLVDGEALVDANVPAGHLTPAEARCLARALEVIAAMVEDAA